jgi:exosortase H (IPTLxxWG-CTERM-specific)
VSKVSKRADQRRSDPSAAGSDGGKGRGRSRGFRAWYEANRRDIRFLVVFGICLVVYYVATLTPPVKDWFFPKYLRANAVASGAILRATGQDVTVEGNSLVSAGGSAIQIERGCDAVEPSALVVAAVVASPVAWSSRLLAAVAGTLALMVLNLVRVLSLYLIRVHYPAVFETMHLDVWQVLFIIMALALWAVWASRAARRARTATPDAAT